MPVTMQTTCRGEVVAVVVVERLRRRHRVRRWPEFYLAMDVPTDLSRATDGVSVKKQRVIYDCRHIVVIHSQQWRLWRRR